MECILIISHDRVKAKEISVPMKFLYVELSLMKKMLLLESELDKLEGRLNRAAIHGSTSLSQFLG